MKTHIPLGDGLFCGTRSVCAMVTTDQNLCTRCVRAIESRLREAIREHCRATDTRVYDPEGLIDRFLGAKETAAP